MAWGCSFNYQLWVTLHSVGTRASKSLKSLGDWTKNESKESKSAHNMCTMKRQKILRQDLLQKTSNKVQHTVKLGYNEQLGTRPFLFVITGLIYVIKWPIWLKQLFVITECSLTTEFIITEFYCICVWLPYSQKSYDLRYFLSWFQSTWFNDLQLFYVLNIKQLWC